MMDSLQTATPIVKGAPEWLTLPFVLIAAGVALALLILFTGARMARKRRQAERDLVDRGEADYVEEGFEVARPITPRAPPLPPGPPETFDEPLPPPPPPAPEPIAEASVPEPEPVAETPAPEPEPAPEPVPESPEPEPEPIDVHEPAPEPQPVVETHEPEPEPEPAAQHPVEPVEGAPAREPEPEPTAEAPNPAAEPLDAGPAGEESAIAEPPVAAEGETAEAPAPVSEPVPEPVPAPAPAPVPAVADDLTRMKGVGPRLAERLNAVGVTSFAQIAALSPEEAAALDAKLGDFQGRLERDRWIDQAAFLARGDIAGFEETFGKL